MRGAVAPALPCSGTTPTNDISSESINPNAINPPNRRTGAISETHTDPKPTAVVTMAAEQGDDIRRNVSRARDATRSRDDCAGTPVAAD
jgi:hypothetical protein